LLTPRDRRLREGAPTLPRECKLIAVLEDSGDCRQTLVCRWSSLHDEHSILAQSRHLVTASDAVKRDEPLLRDDDLQISHVSVICYSLFVVIIYAQVQL